MISKFLVSCTSVLVLPAVFVTSSHADGNSASKLPSPIYGVTIPEGYRRWEFVAPALESAPLNELRAVVGNRTATRAVLRLS
jgi:hypothetical protein